MLYSGLEILAGDDEATKRWKARTVTDLIRLRDALRQANQPGLPSRAPDPDKRRLRIATWNLREFDSGRYGYRLPEAIYYIAEVISAFDLVALQEVRADLEAFNRLLGTLGPAWKAVMTDSDTSTSAHGERMVFLFNSTRVQFQGTAGEVTLSDGDRLFLPDSVDLAIRGGIEIELPDGTDLTEPAKILSEKRADGGYNIDPAALVDLPAGTKIVLPQGIQLAFKGAADEFAYDVVNGRIANKRLDLKTGKTRKFSEPVRLRWPSNMLELGSQQFARTPFIVYFQSDWMKLALCTVHIFYGSNAEGSPEMARRTAEIRALTRSLAKRASAEGNSDSDSYFMVLGDFNIKSREHGTMAALEDNGFVVPPLIREIPAGTNVKRDMYYDQMAFWMGQGATSPHTHLSVSDAGVFDVFKHVFREGDDDPAGEDEAYFRRRMKDVKREYGDYREWRTHQISDHLPMWVEIETDFADAYLTALKGG
ncbi:endonuclease/exonuclease/phosphatase family protein [Donghicola sp. C2-DW-16]|uniref:Endonuclease/exonuclease/phosphatase family protein n=1 Tax=Donghicola mangrovi TaxID=2729614 RepID=A0ABX2PHM8_9RHOB|nr:endonuclease/exonuclease/phosphatase family protein [Donghicola mangrovi]NVO29007.1 endonuclease/exonuclease/phosphatase family protein [Donghicola mangrovi]